MDQSSIDAAIERANIARAAQALSDAKDLIRIRLTIIHAFFSTETTVRELEGYGFAILKYPVVLGLPKPHWDTLDCDAHAYVDRWDLVPEGIPSVFHLNCKKVAFLRVDKWTQVPGREVALDNFTIEAKGLGIIFAWFHQYPPETTEGEGYDPLLRHTVCFFKFGEDYWIVTGRIYHGKAKKLKTAWEMEGEKPKSITKLRKIDLAKLLRRIIPLDWPVKRSM